MTRTPNDQGGRGGVRLAAASGLAIALAVATIDLTAADQWIEVKSAHFTVISNAGEKGTRKLVWQLEQVRGAMAALWAWAKPDLNKPLAVIVVKDENSMRALAPQYWEQRGTVRPGSLWVSGPDQHYLALRADVEADDQATINPYITSYFSYVGLVLDQSLDRDVPVWFRRGFTGVLSNTVVRDDRILLGPVIPWELRILRERPRIALPKLLALSRSAPELKQSTFIEVFDAQAWALVHFLMFGDEGRRSPQLSNFLKLVSSGKEPVAAFTEATGPLDAFDAAFQGYVQRSVFAYSRVNIDVNVERERFPVRALPAAEAASGRALFHTAMDRPVEARAAIAEARKADANSAGSYTAEALLLDREIKRDDARTAYAKAVELGTTSAYAHYRLASLMWRPQPPPELVDQTEALLSKAIERNDRFAAAYAWMGDLRAARKQANGLEFIRRAIVLEPMESHHRLRAAGVLLRDGKPAQARVEAQAALTLADDDDDRREAEALLDRIARVGTTGGQ